MNNKNSLLCNGSPGAPGGEIIIVAEEVQDSKYTVHMQLSGTKLDKKDFFGKVVSLSSY